ncbi:hypothetical protein CRUP_032492, partial [Coryphaenoides rupestris]
MRGGWMSTRPSDERHRQVTHNEIRSHRTYIQHSSLTTSTAPVPVAPTPVSVKAKRMPPRKSGLPTPLPEGFTLVDTDKKRWRLGAIIGQGGFGLIYLASQDVHSAVAEDTGFVIK